MILQSRVLLAVMALLIEVSQSQTCAVAFCNIPPNELIFVISMANMARINLNYQFGTIVAWWFTTINKMAEKYLCITGRPNRQHLGFDTLQRRFVDLRSPNSTAKLQQRRYQLHNLDWLHQQQLRRPFENLRPQHLQPTLPLPSKL